MGKSVSDLAALLDSMSTGETSYLRDLTLGSMLDVVKVGVVTQREHPISEEAAGLFQSALQALGHRVQSVEVGIPSLQEVIDSEAIETLWAAHSGSAWEVYLQGVSGSIKSLADLVKWHKDHPVRDPGCEAREAGLTCSGCVLSS